MPSAELPPALESLAQEGQGTAGSESIHQDAQRDGAHLLQGKAEKSRGVHPREGFGVIKFWPSST